MVVTLCHVSVLELEHALEIVLDETSLKPARPKNFNAGIHVRLVGKLRRIPFVDEPNFGREVLILFPFLILVLFLKGSAWSSY